MAYYAIGIGGTGAKCVEALVHLCAAGLMPEFIKNQAKELYVSFVDPDKSNGTLDRAEKTLKLYSTCRELPTGSIDLLKTPISIAVPDVWSPFGQATKPKLEDFFAYNAMQTKTARIAQLFDVLFSPEEKETPLNEGFRGHPAIGAAVLANTIDLGSGEPWKTFRDKIKLDAGQGDTAKIILFGSIFGGTGASGLPTIARLIKQELTKSKITENYQISAVAMLPYFSFERKDDSEMRAQAENFLINSQAALKYYARPNYLDAFDSLYVLGDHILSTLGPSLKERKKDSEDLIDSKGGNDQRNEPHFLEMYAGLAAINFFKSDHPKGIRMIARKDKSSHGWYDIPPILDSNQLLAKMDQLIRFAFAYDCTYYPTLENITKEGKPYRVPWYVNFFERTESVQLSTVLQKELLKIREYCHSFLYWAMSVQTSAKEVEMNLFNNNAFSERKESDHKQTWVLKKTDNFTVDEFAYLLLPMKAKKEMKSREKYSLSNLWERVSDASVDDAEARGVGRFINALYTECKTERFSQTKTTGKEQSYVH